MPAPLAVRRSAPVAVTVVGAVVPPPTVVAGAIRVRSFCTVSGSFDHRAVNGAQGAAFLADVKKIIEEEL